MRRRLLRRGESVPATRALVAEVAALGDVLPVLLYCTASIATVAAFALVSNPQQFRARREMRARRRRGPVEDGWLARLRFGSRGGSSSRPGSSRHTARPPTVAPGEQIASYWRGDPTSPVLSVFVVPAGPPTETVTPFSV
jgi:hypothetical protein